MIKRPDHIALEYVSYQLAQGHSSITLFDDVCASWSQQCLVALRARAVK